jgi:hypothetical protein
MAVVTYNIQVFLSSSPSSTSLSPLLLILELSSPEFLKVLVPPPGGAVGALGGVDCMTGIFVLNEIQAQDKMCILVGTLHG